MGRVCTGGRVLGHLYRHNDLDIFQHSYESKSLLATLLGAFHIILATSYYDTQVQDGPRKSSPPSVCICISLLY
jgi:hypothetical protein